MARCLLWLPKIKKSIYIGMYIKSIKTCIWYMYIYMYIYMSIYIYLISNIAYPYTYLYKCINIYQLIHIPKYNQNAQNNEKMKTEFCY